MSLTFKEVKQQIRARKIPAIELCQQHDLNPSDFQYRTYHKFFDSKQKSKFKYYTGDLCYTSPFKSTLRLFEKSRLVEVTNIQQFKKYYQISYVDLEKLNSRIDELKQSENQQIEVETQ